MEPVFAGRFECTSGKDDCQQAIKDVEAALEGTPRGSWGILIARLSGGMNYYQTPVSDGEGRILYVYDWLGDEPTHAMVLAAFDRMIERLCKD